MATKKSDFPASTTIENTATLDFVINGQNFKIAKSDFLAALGVTGTISQVGAVTGTPVLDVSGSPDFLIRNLEAGAGVVISTSPENGITIAVEGQVFKKQSINTSTTIDNDTNLAVNAGTNTLTMPTAPTKGIVETKSKSGTATLDAGSNTFETTGTSTETVTAPINKRWNLDGTVWLSL